MKRLAVSFALLLVFAVPPLRAEPATVPVTVRRFVGLPADSAARGAFMDAFREAMDQRELELERRADPGWAASGPRTNPFRLVDLASPDEAWIVDLSVRVPPEVRVSRPRPRDLPRHAPDPRPRVSSVRTSRGLLVVVSVLSPQAAAEGDEPAPVRFSLYFPDARRVVVPSEKLPGGGYDYPWDDAGRAVARVLLETLHRSQALIAGDERADLSPAMRADAEEPQP